MDNVWKFVLLLIPMVIGFGVVPLVFSRLVAPRQQGPIKQEPYECGTEGVGDAWIRFGVQYYVYALLFVVFDVEVVLLFPVAIVLKQSGLVGVIEVAVFLGILVIGLVYAWGRGALEWD